MTVKKAILGMIGIFGFTVTYVYFNLNEQVPQPLPPEAPTRTILSTTPAATPIPQIHIIPPQTHVFQTFNNCGPASLSMQLSYHGIFISQNELGQKLRPYQNRTGDNDDKSVTLEELAKEGETYDLTAYHRPNGSLQVIKQLIAQGLPVVVRTFTQPGEDIGHYRLLRGYDDTTGEIVQDDSLQGANLRFSYDYLSTIWEPFNFEYMVLVPKEREGVVATILGKDVDEKIAWETALDTLERKLPQDPNNVHAAFNMSVAAFHTADFTKSIEYFEKVEQRLPMRTLWYQIEPIQAYFESGHHDRVFQMTEQIFNGGNRAFSELYFLRGEIYRDQGQLQKARDEFKKAIFYNSNYDPARQALEELSS